MKKHLSAIISIFFILFSFSLQAQTGRFYSTDKELSNSLINKVYQDRKGFIWVATENGLNKFDGTRFSIYRHHALDSTSLKNNYVRSLYEDSYGNFWIGCINGLQLYDRATDSFSEIHLQRNDENVTPHITAIIERANGEIWMSTSGQGAISIRVNQTKTDKPFDVTVESGLSERISSLFLNTIFEDSNQNLWIATEGKGLFRYSPETKELKNFKAAQGLTNEDVSSICEDINGNIFVGTLTGGLYVLRKGTSNNADFFSPVPYNNKMTLNIKTLMLDRQGTIYIGTDGEGLKEYNADKNSIVDCQMNAAPFDFSKSKVHSLLQDKDNNLWLGIFQKGIILIPSTLNRFNYYGYKSIQKNTIGSSCVMAIWTDNQSITWIGTDNDGLYGINDQGEQLIHYSHQPGNPTSVPGTIMTIYEDSDENLWLGSYFNGLAKMNKRTGHCEYIPQLSANNSTGVSEKVSCVTEDNHRNLWIGTFGSGIWKIGLNDRSIMRYESTREESNDWKIDRLPNDWISCILKGSDGLLWIGTYNGLACFNPQKNTFINYLNQNNLLPGYVVSSLLESSDGHIWIGTTEGLFCFDKRTEKFIHFTTNNGLPSDVICGMLEDERSNIWISTHQGLSKMIVKDDKFINYYAADGIQGNEFSRGAMFKDRQGKMYFGGTNGITTFYPKEVVEQKKDLKVIITEFFLANRAIKKGDKSGKNVITESSVMDATEFTLAYNENTFSFEFSALEFSNPERIIYQYKIDELGNEWSSTYPGMNRVTFTNLNPGKYTFQVRASDHGNLSDTRTISIIITPPWYQTTWAIFGWVILTCIIIYGIIMYILSRFRHRQERLEMEHQEEINEAKLQFFINISHEIRTPMTLIISPLEKLIAEGNQEKQATYLMIYRNAQRILRLINQLMDIRKLDKGQMHLKYRETDIVGFIYDVMQTFEYQSQKKNIRFIFDHSDKELKAWVDLNNFDKVLLNVLSNAFKYTPEGGEIDIKLSTGCNEAIKGPLKRYFEISVTDNGIGIDKDKIEQIFERFYQINNDLTNSNFGTGIGLHLSRSLVELHQGIIKAKNREEGAGTRFIIRLPMGCDHLKMEDLENPEEMIEKEPIIDRKKSSLPDSLIDEAQDEQKKVKARTRYKVLVIEDDDEIRRYISDELSDSFRISESVNGKDGWEQILKEKPDLIISDVMMPEMDGITLSRKVKQNININHIPIILLTAKSKAEDKIEGLETGADAYIVKPFNSDLLKSTVNNLINNRERLRNRFSNEKQVEEKIVKIERKSNDEILIEKIMKTINEHLDDPNLNVEMLAANAGMSRVHMHRKLKELTNQSARDFIRNIRLKQAATLLSEKKLTVSEVAYATGFSNISHFSSSFKELYGMSPTEYKGNNDSEEAAKEQ
ncbi:two-component regulator propeller domain-containing protein [Bacteroides sp. 51]|uniref:hybrid sensor histidine kinase/response regulator transcription factor n=1 Tax=Bacteroides sp. 51 TaxID=2302938 RepID=UPI0013D5F589|nr:two-component regulator propeller domain-containing protein [Bacteroides sp. 51]NDV81940.1 response regulator [Bacteroides sp. 51]